MIERHPALDNLLEGPKPQYDAACVALASLLPSCKDADWDEESEFLAGLEKVSQGQSIDLHLLMSAVDTSFAEFAPLLQVQVPEKTLSVWLAESSASV